MIQWALHYLYLAETIWLPEEGQLRALLEGRLATAGVAVFDLLYADGRYTCRFEWGGEALAFMATDAAQAYAAALLHLMY